MGLHLKSPHPQNQLKALRLKVVNVSIHHQVYRSKKHEDKISGANGRNVGLNLGTPSNRESEPHPESDGSQSRTPERMLWLGAEKV